MSDLLLYFFMGLLFYQLIKSYRNKWKDAFLIILILLIFGIPGIIVVNVNIRMYNFDDVQCTVIPSVAYGFVTGMNLQLC